MSTSNAYESINENYERYYAEISSLFRESITVQNTIYFIPSNYCKVCPIHFLLLLKLEEGKDVRSGPDILLRI